MDKDIIEFAALTRSGKEYNDVCEAANKARHRCRQLTRALAAAGEYEDDIKNAIFDELFGSYGKNLIIEPGFQCDVGSNIFIVTADIPPNVIAAGVPCKVIRKVEEK